MTTIRELQDADAPAVGWLIADTYGKFNLSHFPAEERARLLGPFQHARSQEKDHQEAIAQVVRAAMVFVAEDHGEIVGVLRGRADKLQSLFVREDHHRQGIGRRLVECFEHECARQGSAAIKLQATLYAVPFYRALGYQRTTGVRRMRSFAGQGLAYQPMKKILREP